jgi:four helix bundle protein
MCGSRRQKRGMNKTSYNVKSLKGYNGAPPEGQPATAHFQTFEDLEAYQAAREFRKAMYAVARALPDLEKFGLISQIRRAAVSLTNNIAEGHGRYHYADQIKFVLMARGSLEELMDDLNLCFDETYLPPAEIEKLKQQGSRVLHLLNGYGRFLREKKAGQVSVLREVPSDDSEDVDEDPFAPAPL